MPKAPNLNELSDDKRAAIIRARLAPTMAEQCRLYFAALNAVEVVRG